METLSKSEIEAVKQISDLTMWKQNEQESIEKMGKFGKKYCDHYKDTVQLIQKDISEIEENM